MDNIFKFCVRFYGNYQTSASVYNATLSSNNKLIVTNPKRYSSTGHVLSLLPRGHQFESHKPQGHGRLTWLLTSGPVRLVEVRAS